MMDKQAVFDAASFGRTIKQLNARPVDWYLPYAGETLYVAPGKDEPTVLYHSKEFGEVVDHAEKTPHPGAFIYPVPSREQLLQVGHKKESLLD